MANDVVAAMDAAGWHRAHVMGHSLGSAIAVELVRRASARVASLSLHSAWASTRRAAHLGAWLEARRATARSNAGPELWGRYAFFLVSPDHFARHGFNGGALRTITEFVAAVDRGAHAGQYDAGLAHDADDLVESIDVPTLVTVGADDFITLPRYGIELAGRLRDAQLVLFESAGHMACLEEAARFNDTQRRFVETLQAGRA
jgi:pimeloyl-ACP methyl ester carboxylesterase